VAASLAEFTQAQAAVIVAAEREVQQMLASLNANRPEASAAALRSAYPAVIDRYSLAAGTLAADWYDDLRADAKVRGYFTALPVEPQLERADGAARRLAGSLFTDDPSALGPGLQAVTDLLVKASARETITSSSIADPRASGWQRISRGASCSFCRMLASRGAVYKQGTATFAAHHDCNCGAVPSWDAGAPEVEAKQYIGSERLDSLRRQAAGEPVTLSRRRIKYLERRGLTPQQDAERQLAAHRTRVRSYLDDTDQ
jgi:hypothetical protein